VAPAKESSAERRLRPVLRRERRRHRPVETHRTPAGGLAQAFTEADGRELLLGVLHRIAPGTWSRHQTPTCRDWFPSVPPCDSDCTGTPQGMAMLGLYGRPTESCAVARRAERCRFRLGTHHRRVLGRT